MHLVKLLRSQEFLIGLALFLGLVWPDLARPLTFTVLPALAVVIFLSTLGVPNKIFTQPVAMLRAGLEGTVLSFVVLGAVTIGLSRLLLDDPHFQAGFVFMAATPPATAVIAFTYSMKGDVTHALSTVLGAYLASLFMTPIILNLFLGGHITVNTWEVVLHIVIVIIIPLAVSRLCLWAGWQRFLDPVKGDVIKGLFFLVFYIMVGLNRQVFFDELDLIWSTALVMVLCYFVLGAVVYWLSRRLGSVLEKAISLTLLTTVKNLGLSGGMALALGGEKAAVPSAVAAIIFLVYITAMGAYMRHRHTLEDA